jgi:phosphoribosylformylglycinamidine synthase I
MKAGILVFPGTNCDRDTQRACGYFGWNTEYIWHDTTNLNDCDVIFVPGGFSYGDYISAGRLAKFSPAVLALKDYVEKQRGFVIGICNGFQILCETGLLPGALSVNDCTRFICEDTHLNLKNGRESSISLPIAHGEGRYIAKEKDLKKINAENMPFLKYFSNPNGSMQDIAGLYDKQKKIIGMMPHPERAVFKETGGTDGCYIFELIEKAVK